MLDRLGGSILLISFGVILVLMLAVTGIAGYQLSALTRQAETTAAVTHEKIHLSQSMRELILMRSQSLSEALTIDNYLDRDKERQRFNGYGRDFIIARGKLLELIDVDAEKELIQEMRIRNRLATKYVENVMDLAVERDPNVDIRPQIKKAFEMFHRAFISLNKVVKLEDKSRLKQLNELAEKNRQTWSVMIILGVGSVSLGLILAFSVVTKERRYARRLLEEIGERTRSEIALRENEQKFKDIAEMASDWFWEMDENLRFSYFSGRNFSVTGYEPSRLIGRTRQEMTNEPMTSEKWKNHIKDLDERRYFRNFEFDTKTASGRNICISISGKPVFDSDGVFTGYRGAGADVTAHREAEKKLQATHNELEIMVAERTKQLKKEIEERKKTQKFLEESEERNRAVLETVPDGIVTIAAHGLIEDLNPAAVKIFGYSRDELIGRNISMLMPEPFSSEHDRYIDNYITTGEAKIIGKGREVPGLRKDGTVFPLAIAVGEISGKGEKRFTATMRDITDQKNAEKSLHLAKEEAETASLTKSEFMANMSHELRSPLNAIIGFSDSMKMKVFGPLGNAKYDEYIVNIHESGQHLLDLINDILDLSVVESGNLTFRETDIDILKLANASLNMIRPRAEQKRIRIKADIPPDIPMLLADERRCKQILINLLTNAVKFTPKGGDVILSAGLIDTGGLFISVTDSGIGMSKEGLETALTAFGQIRDTSAKTHEGAGLGLPLAKSLTESQGGTLSIESDQDKGTVVMIRFPKEKIVSKS